MTQSARRHPGGAVTMSQPVTLRLCSGMAAAAATDGSLADVTVVWRCPSCCREAQLRKRPLLRQGRLPWKFVRGWRGARTSAVRAVLVLPCYAMLCHAPLIIAAGKHASDSLGCLLLLAGPTA